MRSFIGVIFCALIVTVSSCFGEEGLSLIPVKQFYNDTTLTGINPEMMEKYQSASRFFLRSKKENAVETGLVTYETLDTGVNCHIGWYVDGCVATALNGSEAGKQVVILNDSVVGISYDIQFKNDYFLHKYTWGVIYSYPNRQKIVFY